MHIDLATGIIIAANVLISLIGFNDFSFFEKYKFNIAGIRRGEQIRMFSSGFLHADFGHLFFNMLALYFFAGVVIYNVGVPKFVLIYLLSLLAGNLLSFVMHKEEYHYSAVGASGAVMGILYSAILFEPEMRVNFIPGWLFGILFLGYSIYGMKKRIGNIGHDAHFGGAIAGYLLTIGFEPSIIETDLVVVVLLAIPIVVLFVLYKMGKI
ncbi:MAG TPA: rhomboid family intramembrane serine protease [Flavobacteriaceae bacterium]|nr:rhomboid family intramembrane serine protease [Flavobacteriaceae bacterium]MCB9213500.1 rhomboid family intramembrane serine protease [Alteromonas sp.]HPF10726.1 rhomboid family intramembrane serine protease [Flavobacteriaceae bacterium]HQU21566.1 rhomboid family intramembrane serine protease [Flavobacteriaceae bacterium]HQU65535.1 rhomboid family intramembrane serine protease [Flavobacteriaceae bacterium]